MDKKTSKAMLDEILARVASVCPFCNAIGSCCGAAKDRLEAASSLSRLADRQSKMITKLLRAIKRADQEHDHGSQVVARVVIKRVLEEIGETQ